MKDYKPGEFYSMPEKAFPKRPPNAVEVEASVLGAMLLEREAVPS